MANNRELSQFANTVGYNGGNIGINSSAPRSSLDISGDLTITKSSNDPSIIFDEHSGTDPKAKIQMDQTNSTNAELRFFTEGSGTLSERLRIESDGQFVINRSSGAILAESQSKLEVYNSTQNLIWVANSTAATNQDAGIMFAPANNVYGGKIIVTSDEDFSTSANRTAHMAFYTRKDGSATEKLRIDSSGSVGIGTDSMTSALQIYAADTGEGTAKGQITLKDTAAYNQTPTGGILFQGHHTPGAQAIFAGIRGFKANTGNGDYDGCLAFDVRKHGAVAYEAMRINEDGKIGLDGMTNPVAKLHIGTEDDTALTAQTLFVEGAKTGYANYTGLPQNQLCVYDNTASTAGSGGAIGFAANCGGSQQTWIAAIESQRDSSTNDASNYAGSIVFWTRPAQSTPTEKLRITSDGKVGINETAPDRKLHVKSGANSNDGVIRIESANDNIMDVGTDGTGHFLNCVNTDPFRIKFAGTEKLRLTGDALRLGNSLTANAAGRFQVVEERSSGDDNDCNAYFETNRQDWNIKTYYNRAGTHYHLVFVEQGTERGSIRGSDGSNVTFNQGSDYRWKENVVEMTGTEGIEICKRLKPSKYNWIENREQTGEINTVDGFIAHEVVEAGVLGAVVGEKDAVNEDGSIKGQLLDYGQMTPVLAAGIKGLIAKVETLETQNADLLARVTALEGS